MVEAILLELWKYFAQKLEVCQVAAIFFQVISNYDRVTQPIWEYSGNLKKMLQLQKKKKKKKKKNAKCNCVIVKKLQLHTEAKYINQ